MAAFASILPGVGDYRDDGEPGGAHRHLDEFGRSCARWPQCLHRARYTSLLSITLTWIKEIKFRKNIVPAHFFLLLLGGRGEGGKGRNGKREERVRCAPRRPGCQRALEAESLELPDLSDLCLFLFLACCCFFLVVEVPSCAVPPLELVPGLAALPVPLPD